MRDAERLRREVRVVEPAVDVRPMLEDAARLDAARAEAQAAHELLGVITDIQGRFIAGRETSELFDSLLADLLRLTSSEYGFISEVLFEVDGTPYLETRDLTDATWNEEERQRFRSLYRFFNRVINAGKPLISNDPAHDLRTSRSSSSPGRPGLRAFLGLPLFRGLTLVGVAGIVNRPGGYDEALVDYLQPFLTTCANLIEGHRAEQRRRDSEHARLESDARMRAIVDTALDGILTIDELGTIDRVNPAIERMFDRRACDLMQTHVSALIPALATAGGRPGEAASAEATRAAVLGPTREAVVLRADGTTLPLEIVFSEMSVEGRRMFTGILRDVSERQKVDRLKSEFVSTVSHELRTPLTSIRGSLGLLAGGMAGALPEQARAMVAIALQNGERLGRLIDDILDMEKIASGRLEFRLRHIELRDVVQRSLEANQGYAAAHQVRLAIEGEMPPAIVFADEDRVAQVLANLISNATKFSPAGETVAIAMTQGAERARISVIDRGPGIPEEFKKRIFQRFAQADGSDTRQKGGTGLGLSITKAIVERMGGRVGFEANEGPGTTFFFELPVQRSTPTLVHDASCEDARESA